MLLKQKQVHLCFNAEIIYTNFVFAIFTVENEVDYLVKGLRKYPLVLDDICAVIQGKWLNDQVYGLERPNCQNAKL